MAAGQHGNEQRGSEFVSDRTEQDGAQTHACTCVTRPTPLHTPAHLYIHTHTFKHNPGALSEAHLVDAPHKQQRGAPPHGAQHQEEGKAHLQQTRVCVWVGVGGGGATPVC
jgi:hypothetical protein